MKADITLAALATTFAITVLGTPAASQTRVNPIFVEGGPTVRISYRDLDVTTDAGMGALTQRIEGAVRIVCIKAVPPGYAHGDRPQCRRVSRADAWNQVARNSSRGYAESEPLIVLAANRPVAH